LCAMWVQRHLLRVATGAEGNGVTWLGSGGSTPCLQLLRPPPPCRGGVQPAPRLRACVSWGRRKGALCAGACRGLRPWGVRHCVFPFRVRGSPVPATGRAFCHCPLAPRWSAVGCTSARCTVAGQAACQLPATLCSLVALPAGPRGQMFRLRPLRVKLSLPCSLAVADRTLALAGCAWQRRGG
jgi:hypothetical protein